MLIDQHVMQEISKEEVKRSLKSIKNNKAVGPDDIPVEAWKSLGEPAIEFLTCLFNKILDGKSMPEDWRQSTQVP